MMVSAPKTSLAVWWPKLNAKILDELVEARSVRVKVHPEYPNLKLYKYSAGYDFFRGRSSSEEILLVRQCRGLVWDHDKDRCVCNPVPKFFNHFNFDLKHLRDSWARDDVMVTPKHDGSCVLMWHYRGEWHFSTLGSFTSDQAVWAKELLAFHSFEPGDTHAFELIHPKNRIIVDYKDKAELRFLYTRDTQTGLECAPMIGGDLPVWRGGTLDRLMGSLNRKGIEGYVVRFNGGSDRVKFKTWWYLGQSKEAEILRKNGVYAYLIAYYKGRVGFDEKSVYRDEICAGMEQLQNVRTDLEEKVDEVRRFPTRKEQAKRIHELDEGNYVRATMFKILDKQDEKEIALCILKAFMMKQLLPCQPPNIKTLTPSIPVG